MNWVVMYIGIICDTMNPYRCVLDTNVIVAGLRSRRGASFQLLTLLERRAYELAVSVPLVMEYEDVLMRPGMVPLARADVETVLDMICHLAIAQPIHYLWRPQLRDPKDELVFEAAVNAQAAFLVTHNIADFAAASQFNVRVVTPRDALSIFQGALQ